MYPDRNPDFKYAGIFVKEQFEEMNKNKSVFCDLFVINGFKSKFHYLFGSLRVLFKIIFGNYDVVHAHYGLSALFTLLVPFKKWRNVVLTLHGGDILDKQGKNIQVFLTKRILKKVGVVITLNEEMNSVVNSYRSDYQIVPCGVDTDFFVPEEKDLRKHKTQIVFPGNPDRSVKNFSLFKNVIESYIKKYEPVEIVILDGLTRSGVKDAFNCSSALLMTSISEGSPQAVKEALSCDLPVVSSNVGDVKSILGSTPSTAIFEVCDDPEVIADKVYQSLNEYSGSLGKRRERVLNLGLSNKEVVGKLIKMYEGMTNHD